MIVKILEKIVSTQLSIYLEQNNLLPDTYHYGKSTEGIPLLAVTHIATSLDEGKVVCATFIALRKAMDSLNHCLLLTKLPPINGPQTVTQYDNCDSTRDSDSIFIKLMSVTCWWEVRR